SLPERVERIVRELEPQQRDVDPARPATARTRCRKCGQVFAAEGRFCPFDGEALVSAARWDPSEDPLLGKLVDERYEIDARIGEGGMGTVYRARHVRLGKSFALKALRADLALDRDVGHRFLREARMAASVAHPRIVRISDFGALPSGRPYFVMELLEGVPLGALLRGHGPLPPRRAAEIARQIADGLAAAHERGVVHRDLKPDNVHVLSSERGDEIKIVDFGLATAIGGARITREGVVFGTPHYMSPEQGAGEPLDGRTDVYALGVVLFEMLTGRLPFDADSSAALLAQHADAAPRPPSAVTGQPGAFGALDAVVVRCLAKDRAERYASMRELSAALTRWLEGEAAEETRNGAEGSAAPSSRVRNGRAELVAAAPGGGASRERIELEPPPNGAPAALLPSAPSPVPSPPMSGRFPLWVIGIAVGALTALTGIFAVRFLSSRATGAVASDARRAEARPAVEIGSSLEAPLSIPLASAAPTAPEASASVAAQAVTASPPKVTERKLPRRETTPRAPAASARAPVLRQRPRSAIRDELVDPWSR
ncbi:MAG TPA: serine/threonine-protein kinase, partial [Polyangiaceae bacterium]|nr:serine/threonine-protein kinase [Polyangiaceae bacterium]